MPRTYRANGLERTRGVRHIRGDVGFSKLMKQLPEATRDEMAGILKEGGAELAALMKADTPVKTGELRRGITWKLSLKTLRLRVGILGKAKNSGLFYRWIIERGRKAQTVSVQRRRRGAFGLRRGRKKAEDIVSRYQLHVKARAPHPFVFKSRPQFRAKLGQRLRSFWDKVLERASEGVNFNE